VARGGQTGETRPDHEDVGVGHDPMVSKAGAGRTRGPVDGRGGRTTRSPTLER
jgi:hypothetical protein